MTGKVRLLSRRATQSNGMGRMAFTTKGIILSEERKEALYHRSKKLAAYSSLAYTRSE